MELPAGQSGYRTAATVIKPSSRKEGDVTIPVDPMSIEP